MTQASFAGMEAIFFTGGDPLHRRSGHFLGSSSGSSSLGLLAAERAGGDAEATRSGGKNNTNMNIKHSEKTKIKTHPIVSFRNLV